MYCTKQHVGDRRELDDDDDDDADDDSSGGEDNGDDDDDYDDYDGDEYDDVGTTRSFAYIAREDRRRVRKRGGRGKKEKDGREACEIAVQPTHTVVADRRGRQGTRASKMEGRRAWNIKGGT